MQNITKERYCQIKCMQKIQKFKYENESIVYQLEKSQNLSYIINQEQNKIQCYTIGQLFIIINNIVDQLLKVYQISNISKLEMNSIYVNLENNQISFTNIHINQNLVSYEQNLNEIIKITYEIFFQHQKFLVSLINDDNKVDLSKKIQYITEFSNQVLYILKAANHHKELNLFVKKNIKNKQLTHNNFQDVVEIPKAIQQAEIVLQPPGIKDVQIPKAFVQENPLIQTENPQINNIIQQELQIEQIQQQQYQDQDFQNYPEKQQEQQLQEQQEQEQVIIDYQQNLGQSIIDHQTYACIEENLKKIQLGEELYDEMLRYFVKNYKNFEQDQITQKFQQLYNAYYYPKCVDQNVGEDLVRQWQITISDEFITKKTIDLNDDIQEFYQKLNKLLTIQYQSQQGQY